MLEILHPYLDILRLIGWIIILVCGARIAWGLNWVFTKGRDGKRLGFAIGLAASGMSLMAAITSVSLILRTLEIPALGLELTTDLLTLPVIIVAVAMVLVQMALFRQPEE
jgi:hypothetical protein